MALWLLHGTCGFGCLRGREPHPFQAPLALQSAKGSSSKSSSSQPARQLRIMQDSASPKLRGQISRHGRISCPTQPCGEIPAEHVALRVLSCHVRKANVPRLQASAGHSRRLPFELREGLEEDAAWAFTHLRCCSEECAELHLVHSRMKRSCRPRYGRAVQG